MGNPALEFTLSADLTELLQVRPSVNAFLDEVGASRHAVLTVEVTLETIVGNIVKYGHGDGQGRIRVALSIRDGDVRVVIENDGAPFDPTHYAGPRPPAALRGSRDGRIGLRLVRAMASSLLYEHTEGKNRLEMRVPLRQPGLGFTPSGPGRQRPTAGLRGPRTIPDAPRG